MMVLPYLRIIVHMISIVKQFFKYAITIKPSGFGKSPEKCKNLLKFKYPNVSEHLRKIKFRVKINKVYYIGVNEMEL